MGLLSKLACGLLIVCFFMAGTNVFLFSFLGLYEEGSLPNTNQHPTTTTLLVAENANTDPSLHDLSKKVVVQSQRETAIVATNNNNNKDPSKQQDRTPTAKHKPRENAVYRCTYGATNENRTKVVVPNNEPAFIIIGVQKSGSTSLLSHFRDHPQVLQTKLGKRREAHFFDTRWEHQVEKGWEKHGLKGANDRHCFALEEYMKIFETETILANSQTMDHGATTTIMDGNQQHESSNSTHHLPMYTFEKTPMYFTDSFAPARIKQTVPWSKLVLILRNPVDRAYSHYKMIVKTNYNLRKYSLEDFVFHELKIMKKFRMTKAPLMVPVDIKEGAAGNDTNIPIIADHYEFPTIPFDHANMDPTKWKHKDSAMRKKADRLLGKHIVLRRGLYNVQLRWWLEQYTVGQDLLVINYQDLADNIQAVYEQISEFSGIPLPYKPGQDPAEVGIHFDEKVRADNLKQHLPMKDETRRFLTDFYAPYNVELEELLGPEWSAEKLGWNTPVLAASATGKGDEDEDEDD